ncbi:MAG: glycerate kinase [Mogibacterium sp.]|nr:glycerate kinase [Mogibacterium sp.]
MNVLIAPDSFKGSLTAIEVCEIIGRAAREVLPDCTVTPIPIADGGEGTVDSVLTAVAGSRIPVKVHDPLGRRITACYGILGDGTAVMEMAAASGLTLVTREERDVLHSNTFGTGEMLLDAVRRGADPILIGIGGSATNDGGIGMAAALGARFLDGSGAELSPVPASLSSIRKIDLSGIPAEISEARIVILSDVRNPLLGPDGATAVYGPQKGVTPGMIHPLDQAMEHYIVLLEQTTGKQIRDIPGAGAAGGLGAGLLAFTRAEIRSGVDAVLEITEFDRKLQDADLVVTGEGRMDAQSAYGKVVSGIGRRCRDAGVPCVAVVGSTGPGYERLREYGILRVYPAAQDLPLAEAMARAPELCYEAACRAFAGIGRDPALTRPAVTR